MGRGGPRSLGGDGASLGEVVPSALIALIASLATSEIVLRAFDLPGRSLGHRYTVVVTSVCMGGALMGAPLAVLYAIDGTLGADPSRSVLAILYAEPLALIGAIPVALVGAVFRLAIGLAEGLILGVPMAAAIGLFSDYRGRPT